MRTRPSISAVAIITACSACWTGTANAPAPAPAPAGVGTAAPPRICTGAGCLPRVDYVDATGTRVSRGALIGHIVVVNFWATWAHPSQSEIPHLAKVAREDRANGVVVLGVLTDDQVSTSELEAFVAQFGLTYSIIRASPEILSAYGYPQALPTTFIFDRNGKQVTHHIGALDEPALRALLDPLLGRP